LTPSVTGTDAALYAGTIPTITLTVINVSNTATIPSALSVPKGGCSTASNVILTKLPTSDLSISLSSSVLQANNIYTNLTSNQITYGATGNMSQSFLVCSNASAVTGTSVVIPLTVSGTNLSDYKLSTYSLTVTVGSAPTPSVIVSLPTNYSAGTGIFNVSSNVEGYYIYSLRQGNYTTDANNLTLY
jgi:hypothetical protein